jgi:hypothetical protein
MTNKNAIFTGWTIVLALVLTILAPVNVGAQAIKSSPRPYYVALGDSYSSGEGLAPFLAGSGSCDRSPEAYPELVAHRLGNVTLRFSACSGATIAQISDQVASLAPKEFRRTALTTVMAGGDDLPFAGLIRACIGAVTSATSQTIEYLPSVSSATLCASTISGAANLLGASINPVTSGVTIPVSALTFPLTQPSTIESRLIALYSRILHAEGAVRHRATGPQLIVVQYPTLLGSPGSGACQLSSTPLPLPIPTTSGGSTAPLYPAFTNASSFELADLNSYLQIETSVVVERLRSEGYLDVSLAPLESGVAPLDCTTGTSPDLNGLLLSSAGTTTQSGSFHPSASGQAMLAASAVAAWRSATR